MKRLLRSLSAHPELVEGWQILLMLIMISFFSCASTGKHMRGQNMFQDEVLELRESVRKGSPASAVQNLSMLLEMDPKNKDARFLRALSYQKLGQYEMAIKDYETIISKEDTDPKIHYNLGMIYAFKVDDRKQALKYFDRFLSLSPESKKSFDVAKLMCSLDRGPENPSRAKALFANWSRKKAEKEKNGKARKNLLMGAIELEPSNRDSYFNMAREFEEKGDTAGAIKFYKEALLASPTFSEAHYRLGQILIPQGKKEDGQIHLLKASLFSPNDRSYIQQ